MRKWFQLKVQGRHLPLIKLNKLGWIGVNKQQNKVFHANESQTHISWAAEEKLTEKQSSIRADLWLEDVMKIKEPQHADSTRAWGLKASAHHRQ